MIGIEIKGLQETQRKISQMKRTVPNDALGGLFDVVIMIRNNAIMSMQNTVKRGDRVYKRGTIIHRPSAPGWPPAIDTGNLVGSLIPEMDVKENAVRMGSDITTPAYPEYLEKGTIKMAARPWMEPAIDNTVDDLELTVLKKIIGGIESL